MAQVAADPIAAQYPAFGGALLRSAERTADVDVDFSNQSGQSLIIVIDWTAETDAGASIVYTIQGRDPVSGATWDILASAAITAVGTTVLRVSPHIAASANVIAKDIVPPHLRLKVDAADTKRVTYSVAAYFTA